jgi:hypothetical protein
MDESGSLQWTDAEDRRVIAAQTAVLSLAALGDEDGVTVDVALSSFAVDFDLVTGWMQLDSGSVDGLLAEVRTFEDRNLGLDTDYHNAFTGVRDELSRRAAETAGEASRPCQLILLFTDGDYDVEPRERGASGQRGQNITKVYAPDLPLDRPGNPALVEERGRELLCEGGGLLDVLRESDVVTVTLALEEDIDPEASTFLRAVTTGEAEGLTCGEVAGPDYGVYIPATNLAELIAGFNRAANEIAGGTAGLDERELPVCDREACPEGSRTFDLSHAYDHFHLLANTAAESVVVELEGPAGGDQLVLESGQSGAFQVGSVELDVVWLSPVDVAIDGRLSSENDDWVGTWTMTFVDPTGVNTGALASAQLYLFGGLTPELAEEPIFRMGEDATFGIRVVDAVGTPRTPADFVQEARILASVTDPVSGRTQELDVSGPAADGTYVATWPVPSDIEAATVNVSLRLEVIAQTGIALQPRLRTYAVSVQPPVTYPSLGPAQLRLTSISDRAGEAVGTILVTGGAESGGCVWFEGASVQRSPRNADDLTSSFSPPAGAQAECIAVAAGEQREVELTVAVGRVASGSVDGRVQARLASDAAPEVLNTELPFSFEMHRPVDQARRAWMSVLLLLAGFLLPLVVLWGLNWWGARFEPLARLRTGAVPVRITPDGRLRRLRDGHEEPLKFAPEDFDNAPGPNEPVREASVDGLQLTSKVPLFPFRPAYGVVSSGSTHVAGAEGSTGRRGQVRGKVPFNLARQWVFTLESFEIGDGEDPDVRGALRVFLPEGPMRRQIGALEDELARTVPASAQALAREAERRSPPADEPTTEEGPPLEEASRRWAPPTPGGRSASVGGPTSPRSGGSPGWPRAGGPPASSSPSSAGASPAEAGPTATGRASSTSDTSDPDAPGGWQPPKR